MTSHRDSPVVIVGAGVAGLTLGLKLAENGIPVTLLEREPVVGGLARSFSYTNGATFDIGPHRFHTDSNDVKSFVLEVLGNDYHWIRRNSTLFLFGKYLPWPMTVKNVLSLPLPLLACAGLDLLHRPKARTDSFEDYIIEKYGRVLYRAFFQPYTEKFLDYTCSNLHKDWAVTGINRATIDKRVDTGSLWGFAKSVLQSNSPDTQFIYPRSGGIGVFGELLASKIQALGGRILLSSSVTDICSKEGCIETVRTNKGEEIPASHVFWSGSLDTLRTIGRAPESVPKLHYMSTVLFNYVTRKHVSPEFQWCYFGDKTMEASRACLPRCFNPVLAPKGKEAICVEISCAEDSAVWQDPARLDCVVETFLLHARMLDSLDDVEEYHVEHVHDTYPLYVLNYPRKLRGMFTWTHDAWNNLSLIGRTGRFWYNNMDHSIEASLEVARRYVADKKAGVSRQGREYEAEDRYLEGAAL
jgi:protoporphyrinogen oxidase